MSTLVDLLQRDLHRTTASADVAARATSYVLAGSDADVLGAIGPAPLLSVFARKSQPPGISFEERYDMLSALVSLGDPAVLVRYARVELAVEGSGFSPFRPATWPEVPWLDAFLRGVGHYFMWTSKSPLMNCAHIVGMLESEGLTAELLVRATLAAKPGKAEALGRHNVDALARIPGYGGVLACHAPLIREWFRTADAAHCVYVLDLMRKSDCDPEPFLAELIELATGPAKTVRDAAEPLLAHAKDCARPELERLTGEGGSERRAHAFRLMASFYGGEARSFLSQFETERMPLAAREALEKALAATTPAAPAPSAAVPDAIETNVPLSEPAREAFREMAQFQSSQVPQTGARRVLSSAEAVEKQLHLVESLVVAPGEGTPVGLFNLGDTAREALTQFLDRADIELIHVVRLLLLNFTIHKSGDQQGFVHFMPWAGQLLGRFRRRRPFDLRQLGRVLDAIGVDQRAIVHSMVKEGIFQDWDSAVVAPYLLDHLPTLEQLLRERPSTAFGAPATPFYRMLGHLQAIPAPLVDGLWRIATARTTERDHARQILEKLPDLEMRMRGALGGGAAGVRSSIALWFAERGSRSAIPVLREALNAEKQEPVRRAIMMALERLGAPLEAPVDRERLLFESAAVLRKGIPPALDWFPFDTLPQVRWADTSEPVAAVVLKRMLVESHKLRSPEPSPILRRTCAEFRAEDRHALGQFVLDTWLERDLREKPPEQVTLTPFQALLLSFAPPTFQKSAGHNPRMPMGATPFYTLPASAIKDRGILAIAAACAGETAVPKIAAYLKEWYGYRPAQCKALLGVLPWLESPAATQLLLATARRFRTRTIQEEAERLSREMAQRRGWSMDQLGDRTIPDAGFARDGTLQLPLGKRMLTLRLAAQLTTELVTAEGKLLKSFPNASAQDDEELYKSAKADFAAARSTVKTVATQQTQRLYEAFCAEREWAFSELREFLFEHPIVGSLCRRLVWQSADRTFRPLGDGTLTDARDEQVELDGPEKIRLAYCPADADAWRRHLADYEITPLFPQLDRPLHVPADLNAGELADFCGYAVGFFRLNNLVTKFGYRHAPVVDGPGFQSFLKRISGLDLDLELTFSGMQMPPVDETVFLMELRFARAGAPLSLAQVPRVVLSECWYDLKTMADAGTGYDPDWESKVR